MKAKNLFDNISTWGTDDKMKFCQDLLFNLTIMNRALWDDPDMTNDEKVDCLKWSNELSHRIWNLYFELRQGRDENIAQILLDNIIFYKDQNANLQGHFGATLKATYEQFGRQNLNENE